MRDIIDLKKTFVEKQNLCGDKNANDTSQDVKTVKNGQESRTPHYCTV